MKLLSLLPLALLSTGPAYAIGDSLNLAGEWRLRLDVSDHGVAAHWPAAPLAGEKRINLPGTTDLAGFGFPLDQSTMLHATPFPVTTRFPKVKEPVRADEHGYLVRRFLFVGPAWYEREIAIPDFWKERPVALRLERALWKTDVWVDGRPAGSCDSLVAEHRHELGALAPGRHRLTVRVDNRMIHNLSTVTHAYGPETQSRWNGLVGAITLEAAQLVSLQSLMTFPAADRMSVRVVVRIANAGNSAAAIPVRLQLLSETLNLPIAETKAECTAPTGTSSVEAVLRLTEPARAWDEFEPIRYTLRAVIDSGGDAQPAVETKFGFRHIERVGKEMRLNDRPLFLRGTLDCAVYPKTGHPPMTVPEWERVLGVIKEYGFNHVRFHTWCPPEAAFEAADRLGVYLQPEAPAWVDDWGVNTVTKPQGIGRDPAVVEFLRHELRRMSEAYGNHPSFLLCAIGNEFGSKQTDWDRVNAMVEEIKTLDPRRLYAGCGARRRVDADDFCFTHQSGGKARGVGLAHTEWDFARAAAASPVPLIAHETGQRPVFPDYAVLLPKFTGPLLPLNLQRYHRALVASGQAGRLADFVRASARFQLVQYKAEHEAMHRTAGYAGYQLLMLNDFTGQSEALVGILDPFWETKGIVTAADVRAWNAPTVLLARFAKFVWLTTETLRARLEVAHFGRQDLPAGPVDWSLQDHHGAEIARGRLEADAVRVGRVADLGGIAVPLAGIRNPMALTLSVRQADARNSWRLWVYPTREIPPEPAGVLVCRALDATARRVLANGGRVLLLASGLRGARAARTTFESVYWSAGWWGSPFSSLGILCDPGHPALAAFPNDGCSDWQWRDLCEGAVTFDLAGAPTGFRPIVQAVPDFHYNTLLGQVFEAKVGSGSLLVCGYDLTGELDQRPAARQFRRSLYDYASGPSFAPTVEVSLLWLERLLENSPAK